MPKYLVVASYHDSNHDELLPGQHEAASPYEALVQNYMERFCERRCDAVVYLRDACWTGCVLSLPELVKIAYADWLVPWDVTYRLGMRISQYEAAVKVLAPLVTAFASVPDTAASVSIVESFQLLQSMKAVAITERDAISASVERDCRPGTADIEGDRCVDITSKEAVVASA